MSFGGGATVAAARVVLGVDAQQFGPELATAEAQFEGTVGRMGGVTAELAERQLRTAASSERLAAAIKTYGAESVQATEATAALIREQRQLVDVQAENYAAQTKFGRVVQDGQAKTRAFGSALGFTTTALIGGAGLVYGIKSAVDAAQKFQGEMVLLQTQALTTSKEVHEMTKRVLEISPSLATGPNELAQGLYRVESAGYRGAKALGILKTAAMGARLGHADLEQATTALVAAQKSGIVGASNLGQAMGTLDAIVGAGNMRFDDLTRALSSGVVPAARQFGLSLSQLGGALDTLTVQGIPAELAATRLRYTIALLGAQTPKATTELEKIGLTATQVGHTMRTQGLLPALDLLNEKLKSSGLSIEAQNEILVRAFGGGRSSTTILTLIQNLDLLRQKTELIDREGTQQAFHGRWLAQMATAEYQFARLRAIADVTKIRLGDALLPGVVKATSALNDWLSKADTQKRLQHDVAVGFRDATDAAHVFGEALHQIGDVIHTFDGLLGNGSTLKLLLEGFLLFKAAGIAKNFNTAYLDPLRAITKGAKDAEVAVTDLQTATARGAARAGLGGVAAGGVPVWLQGARSSIVGGGAPTLLEKEITDQTAALQDEADAEAQVTDAQAAESEVLTGQSGLTRYIIDDTLARDDHTTAIEAETQAILDQQQALGAPVSASNQQFIARRYRGQLTSSDIASLELFRQGLDPAEQGIINQALSRGTNRGAALAAAKGLTGLDLAQAAMLSYLGARDPITGAPVRTAGELSTGRDVLHQLTQTIRAQRLAPALGTGARTVPSGGGGFLGGGGSTSQFLAPGVYTQSGQRYYRIGPDGRKVPVSADEFYTQGGQIALGAAAAAPGSVAEQVARARKLQAAARAADQKVIADQQARDLAVQNLAAAEAGAIAEPTEAALSPSEATIQSFRLQQSQIRRRIGLLAKEQQARNALIPNPKKFNPAYANLSDEQLAERLAQEEQGLLVAGRQVSNLETLQGAARQASGPYEESQTAITNARAAAQRAEEQLATSQRVAAAVNAAAQEAATAQVVTQRTAGFQHLPLLNEFGVRTATPEEAAAARQAATDAEAVATETRKAAVAAQERATAIAQQAEAERAAATAAKENLSKTGFKPGPANWANRRADLQAQVEKLNRDIATLANGGVLGPEYTTTTSVSALTKARDEARTALGRLATRTVLPSKGERANVRALDKQATATEEAAGAAQKEADAAGQAATAAERTAAARNQEAAATERALAATEKATAESAALQRESDIAMADLRGTLAYLTSDTRRSFIQARDFQASNARGAGSEYLAAGGGFRQVDQVANQLGRNLSGVTSGFSTLDYAMRKQSQLTSDITDAESELISTTRSLTDAEKAANVRQTDQGITNPLVTRGGRGIGAPTDAGVAAAFQARVVGQQNAYATARYLGLDLGALEKQQAQLTEQLALTEEGTKEWEMYASTLASVNKDLALIAEKTAMSAKVTPAGLGLPAARATEEEAGLLAALRGRLGGFGGGQSAFGAGLLLTLFGPQIAGRLGAGGISPLLTGAGSGLIFGQMLGLENPYLGAAIGASFGLKSVIGGRPGSARSQVGSVVGSTAEGAALGAGLGTFFPEFGGPVTGAAVGGAVGLAVTGLRMLFHSSDDTSKKLLGLASAADKAHVSVANARTALQGGQVALANDRVNRDQARAALDTARAEEKAARGTDQHQAALDQLRAAEANYRASVRQVTLDEQANAKSKREIGTATENEKEKVKQLAASVAALVQNFEHERIAGTRFGFAMANDAQKVHDFAARLDDLGNKAQHTNPKLARTYHDLARIIAGMKNLNGMKAFIDVYIRTHLTGAKIDQGIRQGLDQRHNLIGDAAQQRAADERRRRRHDHRTAPSAPPYVDPAQSAYLAHLNSEIAQIQAGLMKGNVKKLEEEELRWLREDYKRARTDAEKQAIAQAISAIQSQLQTQSKKNLQGQGNSLIPQSLQDQYNRAYQHHNRQKELAALEAEKKYLERIAAHSHGARHHKAEQELNQVIRQIASLTHTSTSAANFLTGKDAQEWIRLQNRYAKAQQTRGTKDDIAALKAEQAFLQRVRDHLHGKAQLEANKLLASIDKRLQKLVDLQAQTIKDLEKTYLTDLASFFASFGSNVFTTDANGHRTMGSGGPSGGAGGAGGGGSGPPPFRADNPRSGVTVIQNFPPGTQDAHDRHMIYARQAAQSQFD